MKTITIRNDGADLELTLNELIVIRNSLNQMLSKNIQSDLHSITAFFPHEIETIITSFEEIIEKL